MRDRRAFASAIKELRGKRTQKEVARRAGIDLGAWCAYEKGTRWPRSPQRFERIAMGLQVHVDELDRLTAEHHRRETEAHGLEARLPVAKAPLAAEGAQAYIGETISRITSDLIKLVAFLVAGR